MSERNKGRDLGKCWQMVQGTTKKVLGGVEDRDKGRREAALCSEKGMCCGLREFASVKWDSEPASVWGKSL